MDYDNCSVVQDLQMYRSSFGECCGTKCLSQYRPKGVAAFGHFQFERELHFVCIEFIMFQCDNTVHSFEFAKMTLTMEIDEIVTFALCTSCT